MWEASPTHMRPHKHAACAKTSCHSSKGVVVKQQINQYRSYTPHGGDQTYKIFGSRDLSVFLMDLLGDGDSVHTSENLYENLRTPVKTFLMCTETPVKTCWKFL